MSHISFTNTTKSTPNIPRVLFAKIKDTIMGSDFSLSVVFIGPKKIQNLNKTYRDKDEPTDILSFTVEKGVGEIFFCNSKVKQKAKVFGRPVHNFYPFLFIHGLLHLKGMAHGSKMEKEEEKYRKQFGI